MIVDRYGQLVASHRLARGAGRLDPHPSRYQQLIVLGQCVASLLDLPEV